MTLAAKTSIEQVVAKAFVQFSVDSNFFMEIAKIRAFRVLWQAFGEAHGNGEIFMQFLSMQKLPYDHFLHLMQL